MAEIFNLSDSSSKEVHMNKNLRKLSGMALAVATLGLGVTAHAQSTDASTGMTGSSMSSASTWYAPAGGRYIGLNAGRTDLNSARNATAYDVYAGGMWNKHFGLEIGMADFGRMNRGANAVEAYGFSAKAVGVMPLTQSLGAFAKLGTLYSRTKVIDRGSVVSDHGWGTTYGVGLNFDINPQLAAVAEWDQTNVQLAGTREHINTTSVGLKYRF
jgi:OOP family OmpA-OmpF porin